MTRPAITESVVEEAALRDMLLLKLISGMLHAKGMARIERAI